MRQIPYTMMKFACFERTVEALYKFVVPKPRSECTKAEQLVVTFVAGYIGMTCLSMYISTFRVSLYNPGCLRTYYVGQDPLASVSQVRGLEVCITTPWLV
jgi:hypothetical protein